MEHITSCMPDRIQTIRMTVLPCLQDDGVSLQRPDQCFLCRGMIVPGQGYHYKVMEDPSQDPVLHIEALEDHLHYIPTTTEARPTRNRSIQPFHNDCGGPLLSTPLRWQQSALHRTLLPEMIESTIHTQGNTTIDDYKQLYHLDKLCICSSYYDVLDLYIHAISNDSIQPQEEKKEEDPRGRMTSYVIVLPTDLARVVDVRPLAWKSEHVYGLFHKVVVLEMAWNDTIPPRYIQSQVKQWCQSCFKDPEIETHVYIHRAVDNIDRWRVVIYTRITYECFQRTLHRFFERAFLHPDTPYPGILSWNQLFHSEHMLLPPLNRPRVASPETTGEATLEIAHRIQEWHTRRSYLCNKLEQVIESFIKFKDKELLEPIQFISDQHLNQYIEREDNATTYQVNNQYIEEYAYTLSSSSPPVLSCWKPMPSCCPTYIPYLIDPQSDDMGLLGVVEQPLETKVMLYP
jgi:hypothetical protein